MRKGMNTLYDKTIETDLFRKPNESSDQQGEITYLNYEEVSRLRIPRKRPENLFELQPEDLGLIIRNS